MEGSKVEGRKPGGRKEGRAHLMGVERRAIAHAHEPEDDKELGAEAVAAQLGVDKAEQVAAHTLLEQRSVASQQRDDRGGGAHAKRYMGDHQRQPSRDAHLAGRLAARPAGRPNYNYNFVIIWL